MVVDGTIVHCGSGGRGCLIGVSSFMLRDVSCGWTAGCGSGRGGARDGVRPAIL